MWRTCLVILAGVALACTRESMPSAPAEHALEPEPPAEVELTLTYLANEGVMLSHGELAVVIDGLHRFYGEPYDVLPDDERERLERALGPYAQIDVLVATHRHGDHFHPNATVEHLRANPGALLFAAPQVIDELAAVEGADAVRTRARAIAWNVGEIHRARRRQRCWGARDPRRSLAGRGDPPPEAGALCNSMKQRQPIASRPEHEVQEAEGRGGSGVVTPTKTESGTWVVTRDIALGRAVPGYDEARGDQP